MVASLRAAETVLRRPMTRSAPATRAARKSTAAIAPFSSSVIVRMRSVSISSISRAVEEVAGTFRRHLRIIVQDDRRRQHHVTAARLADQDRPDADVATIGRRLAPFLRRFQQRYELAVRLRRGSDASKPGSATKHRRGSLGRRRQRRAVQDAERQADTSRRSTWATVASISPSRVCCSRTRTPTILPFLSRNGSSQRRRER